MTTEIPAIVKADLRAGLFSKPVETYVIPIAVPTPRSAIPKIVRPGSTNHLVMLKNSSIAAVATKAIPKTLITRSREPLITPDQKTPLITE